MPVTPFGTLSDGRAVDRIDLASGPLRVSILTLGAILCDVRLGTGQSLTAGSDDLTAYADGPLAYAGAIVGPVANRIGGARAMLEGAHLSFEANAAGGHHLHGGADGLHGKVWSIHEIGAAHVTLCLDLADGQGHYPGARHARAVYTLADDGLTLEILGETDAPTLWAPANHSYWTLGDGVDGTDLTVAAAHVLECDKTVLPTGKLRAVSGTRFDLRNGRKLAPEDRFDTCFCLSDADQPLRPVAWVSGPDHQMTLATTAPGLQVFTADPFATPGVPGHDGRRYGPRFGVALEAQAWPDAPNHPHFPSVVLRPGDTWSQTTRWQFGPRIQACPANP